MVRESLLRTQAAVFAFGIRSTVPNCPGLRERWAARWPSHLTENGSPSAAIIKFRLWELITGKRMRILAGHDSLVRDVVFTRDGKGLIANADLSPTLWDLAPKDLPAANETLWELLAGDDAEKSFAAQWSLVRDSKTAIGLFKDRVKPAEQNIERAQFDKLVADLDSPQFRTREFAEKELAKAGHKVSLTWLRQAYEGAKSAEQAIRLNRLRDIAREADAARGATYASRSSPRAFRRERRQGTAALVVRRSAGKSTRGGSDRCAGTIGETR